MIYDVELWAFCNGMLRQVETTERTHAEWNGRDDLALEGIFYWGQNDHQPQEMPSVSVGDVARLGDDRWLCCSVGWKKLEQYDYIAYTRMSQTDRILKCLCQQ